KYTYYLSAGTVNGKKPVLFPTYLFNYPSLSPEYHKTHSCQGQMCWLDLCVCVWWCVCVCVLVCVCVCCVCGGCVCFLLWCVCVGVVSFTPWRAKPENYCTRLESSV